MLCGLCLAMPLSSRAADNSLAGNWKVIVLGQEHDIFWLVKLEDKDGQWSASLLDQAARFPPTTIEHLTVADGQIRLAFHVEERTLTFEGKLPAHPSRKIPGSIDLARETVAAALEATPHTSIAAINIDLVEHATGPEVFDKVVEMINQASAKKHTPDRVGAWASRAFELAAAYGPRWQREMGLRLALALSNDERLSKLAMEYAHRTEKLLRATDDPKTQLPVLEMLAAVLRNADQNADAAKVEARIDQLEAPQDKAFLAKLPAIKPEPFAGRNGKSDHVVLVELFTGAECRPCAAADIAFDALAKSYQPTEVVLLQYHEHIPGPDPLANADTEARMEYYNKHYPNDVDGTPAILFDGKPSEAGGGPVKFARESYLHYREALDPLLEKPARAKIRAQAVRKGDIIDINAEVSDLAQTGDGIRLRLALVEEVVRYVGQNQMRFHHRVVRAFAGDAEGMALTEKTGKYTASVDLRELRRKLKGYLDEFNKKHPFPNARRPLALANLSIVAFVQNDATREVLQAAQVEVRDSGVAEK
jgi:hypothetical protein